MSDQTPAAPEPDQPSPASPPPDDAPTEPVEAAAADPAPADDAPTEPIEAAAADFAPADEAPTETAPPAAGATPSPTPVAPAPATADRGRGVFVPAWVAVVAGALLVGLLGFAIGWVAAPGDDTDTSNAVATQPSPGTDDSGRAPSTDDDANRGGDDERGARPDVPDRGDDANDGAPTPPVFSGAYFGVTVESVDDDGGARLTAVADDGPAAEASLQTGDVVTAVDGDDVESSLDLIRAIRQREPGDRITITYTRDGNSADAEVTLSERPETQSVS